MALITASTSLGLSFDRIVTVIKKPRLFWAQLKISVSTAMYRPRYNKNLNKQAVVQDTWYRKIVPAPIHPILLKIFVKEILLYLDCFLCYLYCNLHFSAPLNVSFSQMKNENRKSHVGFGHT